MLDRETKYTKELAKCRENIKRTKSLIDYHKNIFTLHHTFTKGF